MQKADATGTVTVSVPDHRELRVGTHPKEGRMP